jgi:hypothetical protein
MDRCYFFTDYQISEVIGVTVPSWLREYEVRTGHQRPEEFPDRDIEAYRSLLQDSVFATELVRVLHPQEPIANGTVFIHGPFWSTG